MFFSQKLLVIGSKLWMNIHLMVLAYNFFNRSEFQDCEGSVEQISQRALRGNIFKLFYLNPPIHSTASCNVPWMVLIQIYVFICVSIGNPRWLLVLEKVLRSEKKISYTFVPESKQFIDIYYGL